MFSFIPDSSLQIIGQGFGIFALIGTVICYQFNSRRRILLMQILCAVLFMLNLACLGAWAGALLNIHGIVRACVFYQKDRHSWAASEWWTVFFCALAVVCVVFTWRSPVDLLPLVGTVFTTLSLSRKAPRQIRFLTLPSPPCWFAYHLLNRNAGGVLNEIFVLSSILIAMVRYGDFKRRAPDSK